MGVKVGVGVSLAVDVEVMVGVSEGVMLGVAVFSGVGGSPIIVNEPAACSSVPVYSWTSYNPGCQSSVACSNVAEPIPSSASSHFLVS